MPEKQIVALIKNFIRDSKTVFCAEESRGLNPAQLFGGNWVYVKTDKVNNYNIQTWIREDLLMAHDEEEEE